MQGIIKKELNQYFRTMSAYVFFAVFAAVSGFYFVMINLVGRSGDIKDFYSSISSVLLFLLPVLTMRSYSEERRQHTDELLLTAPVKLTTLITGKFLACFIMFLISSSVLWIYTAVLGFHGSFAAADSLSNYLGFILMSGAFISIGLFVSVLAESQLTSAIVSYAVLLFMTVIDSASTSGNSAFLAFLAKAMSLNGHYEYFTYGIFSLKNIVYFLSVTAFFLFLSVFALENKRLD